MKKISSKLQDHLLGELTSLAMLVKITCINGLEIGLTSHDCNLTYEGFLYHADGAITDIGHVEQSLESTNENISVSGVLSSDLISDKDIRSGHYDYARIDMYLCNWRDLSAGVVCLKSGWVGEIVMSEGQYKTTFLPFTTYLSKSVGETYTPECRFNLGDNNCSVNCAEYETVGSVTAVTDRNCFVDVNRFEDSDYFKNACLEFTSGYNSGVSLEVNDWNSNTNEFHFWLPAPYLISAGDLYKITAGCDKRFLTCKDRFNNTKNFGGFPYLPGIGKILEYPNT